MCTAYAAAYEVTAEVNLMELGYAEPAMYIGVKLAQTESSCSNDSACQIVD